MVKPLIKSEFFGKRIGYFGSYGIGHIGEMKGITEKTKTSKDKSKKKKSKKK
jgi:hypothetical protein